MKTVKKQGLTAQEKKYLKSRIIWYYLFAVNIKRAPKRITPTRHPSALPPLKPDPRPKTLEAANTAESPRKNWIKFPGIFRSKVAKTMAILTVFLAVVVLLQIVYPSNRSLPLSRMESAGYLGFADKDTILSSFEDFDSRVVTVHTHTKSITTSYKDLGVTIKPFETVDNMTSYSLSERLVPFSILVKGNKSFPISRSIDEAQLKLFVDNVIAQASKQPIDAQIKLKGTQLIVDKSEEGYEYQASALRSRVLRADLADRGQIVFTPTILDPSINTDDAAAVANRMQQRIDNPLLINAENKSRRIEPATMASWIDIIHKPKEKLVDVVFDKKRVDETLRSFTAEVDRDPVPTVVTYLNGSQAGRVDGSVGKVLQYDDLVKRVVSNTSPLTSTLEASVVTVPPPQVIDRKYTKDSQGLQTLLAYWTSVNPGQYSIDFRTINGNIQASLSPHRLLPSVGVFRAYVASLIYGKVTAGSITLGTVTQTGQTVDVCLDIMIRESDEACTNALGSLVDWGASDSLLKAQGFDSTTITQGAGLTTANDMSDWMLKLLGSGITTTWQAEALTDAMTRQVYRSGIPAGSTGMLVANKFGSYGRITNDIGIVYHPNGTYVLSVLSEGSDASRIADLANEINKVMHQ